jgi:hypothetical protein
LVIVGGSVLLGIALGLLIVDLLVIQSIPLAAGVVATLIGLCQLAVAYLLYLVTRDQAKISKRQMEIQHAESVQAGAVVQAVQVPVDSTGVGTGVQVFGIEVWNAGRQATQIRDAWFQWGDDYFGHPKARFLWHEGGPHKGVEMTLETRLCEPGKMWQLKVVLDPPQTIMGKRDPRLVIVPVLGERVEVQLADPTALTGFPRF